MSRINLLCNLTQEEKRQAFSKFQDDLSDDEMREIMEAEDNYLFYDPDGKNTRDCVCTHPDCGRFSVSRKEDSSFFRNHHGDDGYCPRCGQKVKLIAMGRMTTFATLTDKWTPVTICRAADNGALLLLSGYAYRDYSFENLRPLPVIRWKVWTYLDTGKRMQWAFYHIRDGFFTKRYVENRYFVREPFRPQYYYSDGASYWVNAGAIFNSNLKYSQVDDWYVHTVHNNIYTDRVRDALRYLSYYTQFPSMEMAVKTQMYDAITSLIFNGKKHARILDWSAKNLPDFVRMSKADCKTFFRAPGHSLFALQAYHDAKKTNQIKDMADYYKIISTYNINGTRQFEKLRSVAESAGTTIWEAGRYITKDATNSTAAENRMDLWKDYISAAKALGYDLSRQDVLMPKDLRARHDIATNTLTLVQRQDAVKACNHITEKLKKAYEFTYGDLCIVVPTCPQEIIREGKVLKHCVGGYADRHFRGQTTILFLRHQRKPDKPYITIEIRPRSKGKSYVSIVQVHGYRNEQYQHKGDPIKKFDWFLDAWKSWVQSGSPRDRHGKPIIKYKEATA